MVHDAPPLLIITNLPKAFRLAELALSDEALALIFMNHQKYPNLEMIEVVFDGLSFILTLQRPAELAKNVSMENLGQVFCEEPHGEASAIGISLDENLSSGKHVAAVNQAFLRVARLIGESINADSIAWLPAKQNIGFEYFCEAVDQYVGGGPFPVLVQVGISESNDRLCETKGLSYFADQEIRLHSPAGYPENDALKRLVRIIHDIATNGKLTDAIETEGLVAGETIAFAPSDDLKFVDITISVQTH